MRWPRMCRSSQYGVILAMDESPVRENLLYVGTDDGLIQISEDACAWRKAGEPRRAGHHLRQRRAY